MRTCSDAVELESPGAAADVSSGSNVDAGYRDWNALRPCLARSVDNSIVAPKCPGLNLISTVDFLSLC